MQHVSTQEGERIITKSDIAMQMCFRPVDNNFSIYKTSFHNRIVHQTSVYL